MPKGKRSKKGIKEKLSEQLAAVRFPVRIHFYQYNEAVTIMQKLEQLISPHFPSSRVYLTRHWYLQLKSMGTNELVIFVDVAGRLETDGEDEEGKAIREKFEEFLTSLNWYGQPQGFRIMDPSTSTNEDSDFPREPGGLQILYEPNGFKFSLVYQLGFMVEAQTCRLFQYLCEFDRRVKPLLEWIYAWMTFNKIKISPLVCDQSFLIPCPEPSAVEWLVVLFLCRKGILPSPSKLQQRSHKRIIVDKTDIGFLVDVNFAKKWANRTQLPGLERDSFILNVMNLAKEFFSFLAHELPNEHIYLNTRHGLVLPILEISTATDTAEVKSLMGQDEITHLRAMTRSRFNPLAGGGQRQVFVLHPFSVTRVIPILIEDWDKTLEVMGRVANMWEDYLTFFEHGLGLVASDKVNLEELFYSDEEKVGIIRKCLRNPFGSGSLKKVLKSLKS